MKMLPQLDNDGLRNVLDSANDSISDSIYFYIKIKTRESIWKDVLESFYYSFWVSNIVSQEVGEV